MLQLNKTSQSWARDNTAETTRPCFIPKHFCLWHYSTVHAWLYSFWLLHLNTKAHLSTFCSSLKAITYCHVDVVAKLSNCRIPSSGISSCICACWVLACCNFLAGGCRWQHGQSGSLHTYNSSLCGTQTACDRHSNSFPPWG